MEKLTVSETVRWQWARALALVGKQRDEQRWGKKTKIIKARHTPMGSDEEG